MDLKTVREHLEKNVAQIDIAPFAHNIVGMALAFVAEEHGNKVANELIDEFNLEAHGWVKEEEEEEEREEA